MEQPSMTRRGLLRSALGLAAASLLPDAGAQTPNADLVTLPSRVRFTKRVINADSDFEAANAADIDGDGRLDIVCGDTWYAAPDWMPHVFREIGSWGKGPDSSGYRNDFADLP